MFQSRQGILVVDLDMYQVLRGIRFDRGPAHPGVVDWVDPIAQAVYGDLLLSLNRNNFEVAVISRREEDSLVTIPLGGNGPSTIACVGDRALIGHNEQSGLLIVDLLALGSAVRRSGPHTLIIGRDPQEVAVEEIKEFGEYLRGSRPTATDWTSTMSRLPERQVKEAICEILGDIPKADWGGETADHYTAALHIGGKRFTGAFLFKGPTEFRPMTMDMLGKRANQIQRLAGTEAGVLVVQHSHEISEDVRKELRVWAREGPYPRYYCLIDGKDTFRLLKAYGKV